MSPKPIHKRRPDETRDAIWAVIRDITRFALVHKQQETAPFTVADIYRETRLGKDTTRDYLTGLKNAGYLEALPAPDPRSPVTYILVKDTGLEAPRVRKDGTPVTMGQGRERIWTALGIKAQKGHRFNSADLAIHPEVSEVDVKHYLRYLKAAGYVQEVKKGGPGVRALYRMAMDKWTGPKPPQIQRLRQLYDPNRKAVVWSEDDPQGGAE